ncbi:carbon-nitrogen hydrolase family protein [Microbacterium luticocti]|uniref:carbon-nitrogen hydrolase family protein n=1 Tax=Microbacterium luticocti TaxID=451764 RepID=UPI000400A549|nr:carbon-nitrogen hydrolase family protein [Microbacterium luticocti]
MRLALAQMGSTTDVAANLERVRVLAGRAAARNADLVCFPEYTMYEKKTVDASFPPAAQPIDGSFARELSGIAATAGVALVAGMVESRPGGGHPYNTLVAFHADGRLAGRYRKQHLFDAYGFRESAWISTPAPEDVVLTLAGVRVGLMICSDLRVPGPAARLADAGAQLLLTAASWVPGPTKTDQWRVLNRARAVENVCYVAGVCQCPPVSIGQSLVVDPLGQVIGALGADEDLLLADVDPDRLDAIRVDAAR